MGELIIQSERHVPAKGIKKEVLPDENKLRTFFFSRDYELIRALPSLPHQFSSPTLFYPGCGADILTPLLFTEHLFPGITQLRLYFVDLFPPEGLIKTTLDEVGIPFSEKKGNLQFYWRGILTTLYCHAENVFTVPLPLFDIYFERAFRIMKDQNPEFEQRVFSKLKSGGILISDSGFQQFPLQKIFVPAELSSYGEMVAGVKT